jgi:hypothetical protein
VPIDGSLNVWVKVVGFTGASSQTIFYHAGVTGAIQLTLDQVTGGVYYQWGTALQTTESYMDLDNWHMLTMTRDINTVSFYFDGVFSHSVATSAFLPHATNLFYSGCIGASAAYSLNGYLDDFAMIDRVLSADEIRAIYESNAPIFAETSTFSWRTPNNLAWADANGLWAVDKDGAYAFGVVGVDAYSWGGFSVDAGDIVFGRNVVGSSAIKWDISAGKFGFYGGGVATPQVEIGADGKLYAGGGYTILDADGMTLITTSNGFLSTQAVGWKDIEDHEFANIFGFVGEGEVGIITKIVDQLNIKDGYFGFEISRASAIPYSTLNFTLDPLLGSRLMASGTANGDFEISGNYQVSRNSTKLTGYLYVPVGRLTSTAYSGDSFSTSGKTEINLASMFGLPAGIKAINCRAMCRDSGSAAGTDIVFLLSDVATDMVGEYWNRMDGVPNDKWHEYLGMVNCNASGNVYQQIKASGVGTMDVWWEIYGYWI